MIPYKASLVRGQCRPLNEVLQNIAVMLVVGTSLAVRRISKIFM